jgi:hypothetical protein
VTKLLLVEITDVPTDLFQEIEGDLRKVLDEWGYEATMTEVRDDGFGRLVKLQANGTERS